MTENVQSTIMFNAADESYGASTERFGVAYGNLVDANYVEDSSFNNGLGYFDGDNGFKVYAFRNLLTNEYVIAFTGTQPSSTQDIYTNVNLGLTQWSGNNRIQVTGYINRLRDEVGQDVSIHFTGHSLGGALAQYAAYDYVNEIINVQELTPPNITLTTFNGLGGIDGLEQNWNDNLDATVVASISENTHHYHTNGDIVYRLGGGHLGGNVYLMGDEDEYHDLAESHGMDYMRDIINTQGGVVLDGAPSTPDYLDIRNGQRTVAAVGNTLSLPMIGEADVFGSTEAGVRAVGAVLVGFATAPVADINELIQALGQNLHDAGWVVDEVAYNVFMSNRWGQLFQEASNSDLDRALNSMEVFSMLSQTALRMVGYEEYLSDYLAYLDLGYIFGSSGATSIMEFLGSAASFYSNYGGDLYQAARQLVGVHSTDISVSDVTLTEGGTGTLTITMDNITAMDWNQHYIVRVNDPDRVSLSRDILVNPIAGEPGAYSVLIARGENHVDITVHALPEDEADHTDNSISFEVEYAPFMDLNSFYQNDTRLSTGTIHITDTTEVRTYEEVITRYIGALQAYRFARSYISVDPGYEGGDWHNLAMGHDITVINQGGDFDIYPDSIISPQTGGYYWLPDGWDGQSEYVGIATDGSRFISLEYLVNYFHLPEDHPDYLPAPVVGNVAYTPGRYEQANDRLFPVYGDATVFAYDGIDAITTAFGNDEVYAGAGNDVASTGPGDDFLYGEEGDDILGGESGNDTIYGGTGNDLITGGFDDDVLYGGDGNDFIDGELVNINFQDSDIPPSAYGDLPPDYISVYILLQGDYSYQLVEQQIPMQANATQGMNFQVPVGLDRGHNFQITAHNPLFPIDVDTEAYYLGDDYIDGGAGNDYMLGWGGDDSLLGGSGNDYAHGGTGNDYLNGGNGNDWLVGWRGSDSLHGGDGHDTLYGNQGDDYLYGNAGHDMLLGDMLIEDPENPGEFIDDPDNFGNDFLSGGAGRDDLLGGYGNDTLYGGEDNDNLWGGEGRDFLSGDAGDDHIEGEAGDDYISGGAGHDEILGGEGNDSLYGGAGTDILEGGAGDDVLDGGSGNNSLWGDAGDDTLYGGAWNESLDGGDDNDRLYGRGGVDTLHGGNGDDYLSGGEMTDNLYGDAGEDILFGGQGDDNMQGGSNNDYMDGGADNDDMDGGTGNDIMIGGSGGDRLLGQSGDDVLYGGEGIDQIYGHDGADELFGGSDRDGLYGGAGNDILNGGTGNDLLYGYSDDDTFIFDEYFGKDTIFAAGSSGVNIIQFSSENILPDQVSLYQNDYDLFIVVGDGNNWIKVEAYYNNPDSIETSNSRISEIQFSNGTIWDAAYIQSNVIHGSANNMTYSGVQAETILVDHVNDVVTVDQNSAIETVETWIDYVLPENIENLTLTGVLDSDATGNSLNNVLTGNAGNNTFESGGGSDTFIGGAGDDEYYGAHNIVEMENEGNDTLYVNYGYFYPDENDWLADNVENIKTISGEWRNSASTYRGNDLDNIIDLRNGVGVHDEVLDGGAGADTMYGTRNDNTYIVDNINDVVIEEGLGSASDTVESSALNYQLPNHVESLILTGSDAINGSGNGDDNLLDSLSNSAVNILAGGLGDDVYVIGDNDTVVELAGEGTDIIELRNRGLGNYYIDNYAFTNVEGLRLGEGTTGNLVGNDLDNYLYGEGSNNTLTGGKGNDYLEGGRGSDTYVFNLGDGQDFIRESNGDDTIQFGPGIVQAMLLFSLNNNDLVINLADGDDSITIDNWLDGGGNNLENLRFDDGAVIALSILVNDVVNVIEGTDEGETLDGYIDTVDHEFYGYGGNDTLNGTRTDGADVLYGGEGNDIYRLAENDTVVENPDEGQDGIILSDFSTIDFSLSANVENLTLNTSQDGNLTGNALDNSIVAGSGDNTLAGLQGDDYLEGGQGNDVYVFNLGDGQDVLFDDDLTPDNLDAIQFGEGIEFTDLNIYGENGNLVIAINNSTDQITINQWFNGDRYRVEQLTFFAGSTVDISRNVYEDHVVITGSGWFQGGETDDHLYGSDTNDTIYGNGGDDYISGGAGADTMWGEQGDDTYVIDNAGDSISGESSTEGVDTVQSSIDYTLGFNLENLTLIGNEDLYATGNTLDNIIVGNSGNNVLTGRQGNDNLYGGSGNDRYIFAADSGVNQISDMDTTAGNIDVIYFDDTVVSGDVVWVQDDDNLIISINDTTTSITVIDFFAGRENIVEQIVFDSGEVWDLSDITNVADAVATTSHDLLRGDVSDNVINGLQGVDEIHGGAGNDQLFGDEENDYLLGEAGNDVLDGGTGNDILIGGTGDDTYYVDNNHDVIIENNDEGSDTIFTSFSYTLGDHIENLNLEGMENLDAIGNALGNQIRGNNGNNQLFGGAGNDVLHGGAGDDLLSAATGESTGQEYLYGEDGNDWLIGSDVDTFMYGGNGDDNLVAGNGYTEATGGNGDDILYASNAGSILIGDDLSELATGSDQLNGADGIDYLYGGNGDDLLYGNSGEDFLYGGSGNDQLNGGLGADFMQGNNGDDTYIIHEASDVVNELVDEGIDSIQSFIDYELGQNVENLSLLGSSNIAATGNDLDNTILGNSGANIINAGDGDDIIHGGAGTDSINGGAGNDVITGDEITVGGYEVLFGNDGNDHITGGVGNSIIFGNAGEDTLISSGGGLSYLIGDDWGSTAGDNDILIGSADADSMWGNGGADVLNGGGGNDTLDGGTGNDTLNGGSGDDAYIVDSIGDVITEQLNEGIDSVHSSVTYTLTDNVENLTLVGTENINGTGNSLDNAIIGNAGANIINAGDGDDIIHGGAGTDSINGGAGNDVITGDEITAGGYEVLFGNEGNDHITGGVGNSILLGNAGEDTLISSGGGLSYLIGDDWGSTAGNNDILIGSADADSMWGNGGADVLNGGGGNDTLDGGTGNDMLNGGSGDDTYLFSLNNGIDQLTDLSGNDRILFESSISANQLWFEQNGNTLEVSMIGEQDSINISDWFVSGENHIETFSDGAGMTLDHNQVDQLVSAMAAFGVENPGEFTPSQEQQQQLDQLVSAHWQAA